MLLQWVFTSLFSAFQITLHHFPDNSVTITSSTTHSTSRSKTYSTCVTHFKWMLTLSLLTYSSSSNPQLHLNQVIISQRCAPSFSEMLLLVETPRVGPSPRRFVPASAIPDLRAANAAARSSMHNRNRPRMFNTPPAAPQSQGPSRSVSRMSQDSLFYSRPASIALQRRSMDQDPNVTDFQTIRQGFENQAGTAQLNRYDGSVTASVRLAMEEKRRKHDQQMAQMKWVFLLDLDFN